MVSLGWNTAGMFEGGPELSQLHVLQRLESGRGTKSLRLHAVNPSPPLSKHMQP